MSKTFKSVALPNVSVSIKPSSDGVRICSAHGLDVSNVTVSTEDAPALALAILEAAGFDGDETMFTGLAVANLRDHVEEQERATAEAEAQAKMEAEALEFLHVTQKHNNIPLTESWDGFMDGGTKLLYVNMARRARELNQEEK